MPLAPSTQLGRYSIVSSLGAGGMGEVYRARDSTLDREVAIKVLPASATGDADWLARFEREAKALAALNHPNIATLFGMERAELDGQEQPFLVMELVEGPTLADRIGQGRLGWKEAARVFLDIASGMEAAHERGIIHRDLKPANVKLGTGDATGSHRVKVLDFGLAKAMSGDPGSGPSLGMDDPTMSMGSQTVRGTVLGTPGYMAPEQAHGGTVDKRADVWAFGVCLFEALSGSVAFGGDSVQARLTAILAAEPDWQALPGDVPVRMVGLLKRCLVKTAGTRLRDIGEARIALGEMLSDPEAAMAASAGSSSVTTAVGLPRWLLPVAVATGVALGAALVVGLGGAGDAGSAPAADTVVRFAIGAPDGSELENVGIPAISPDGRWVAWAGVPDTAQNRVGAGMPLQLRALDDFDSETRALKGTDGALAPFFSPDSQWVGYMMGSGGLRTLYKVNVESGSIVQVTSGTHAGYQATWAEDGTIYVGEARGGLRAVAPGTDRPGKEMAVREDAGGELAQIGPEALPGGRGLLFSSLKAQGTESSVNLLDLETGETRTILPRANQVRYLDSGHLLYSLEGDLLLIDFDLDSLTVLGDPRTVLEGVRTWPLGETAFDVSENGTLVYLPGPVERASQMSLVWVSPDGEAGEVIAQGDLSLPSISADGRVIVASSGISELTVFEDGSPLPRKINTSVGIVGPAMLMPGTREVIFNSPSIGESRSLRLNRLDLSSGVTTPIDTGDLDNGFLLVAAIHPTLPETILMAAGEGSSPTDISTDLAVGNLEWQTTGRALTRTITHESSAAFSRDGTMVAWVAFNRPSDLFGTLFVADYPDFGRQIAVSELVEPRGFAWGPEGTLWFLAAGPQEMKQARFARDPELRVVNIESRFGKVQSFWSDRGIAVAPDGRLLMVRGGLRGTSSGSGRMRVVVGWAQEFGLQ